MPFIVVAPGVTGEGVRCDLPVDLSVIYPTLLELGGLSPEKCDGVSVVPLLRDPNHEWKRPALMTYGRGNHAVRSKRWRYIRYADGSEELYDHTVDPNEWENVAGRSDYEVIKAAHRTFLPVKEAQLVPGLRR